MMSLQDKIFKLKGKVQHYHWGGFEFIPRWLGIKNEEHKPHAEYWMGAHSSASSTIIMNDKEVLLYNLIKENPLSTIGEKVNNEFGELPYLFKILDVKDMLSIQVHPSKEGAIKGFEAEEAAGIPVNASNRNYKDKNHKPEVMVALSEFWLLHGFKGKKELVNTLESIPEFKSLLTIFENKGYKELYQHVMQLTQQKVNEILQPVIQRTLEQKNSGRLSKEQPGWWAAKLYEAKAIDKIDRGIFSIYFFNIVKVNPGEAIFQGAGIPHAYLEGQNVELMANSDNVLRGGLTMKHIDVPELMKHILFEEIKPCVLKGNKISGNEKNYSCPVSDFGINKIELQSGDILTCTSGSMEIIAVINGAIEITGTRSLTFKKGEVACIFHNEKYSVAAFENTLAYKAFVP